MGATHDDEAKEADRLNAPDDATTCGALFSRGLGMATTRGPVDVASRGGYFERMGDDESDRDDRDERSSLYERAVPEGIRRIIEKGVEKGVEKIAEGPENIRSFFGDLRLPKEVIAYLFTQIDDTKKGIYRVVAKEIRDVLEHTNFADEIADLLTKLSFEVSMQVRFVPNTAAREGLRDEDGEEAGPEGEPEEAGEEQKEGRTRLKPQVVSKVVMKAREKLGERRPKE